MNICYLLASLFSEEVRSKRYEVKFQQVEISGGDDGIRTHDPLLAGQVLSQLSYTPINGTLLSISV